LLEGPWLLEVVATQYPPSCHVYLVVSFGRRQLRQHVCSSGPAACLAAVRMEVSVSNFAVATLKISVELFRAAKRTVDLMVES